MSTKSSPIIAHAGLLTAIVGGGFIRHSDVLYGRHPDLLLAGIGAILGLLGLAAGVWACIDAANTNGRSLWHGLWGVTWAGPAAVWVLTRRARRWWHPWLPVAILTTVAVVLTMIIGLRSRTQPDLPPVRITTISPPPAKPASVGTTDNQLSPEDDLPPVRITTIPPPANTGQAP